MSQKRIAHSLEYGAFRLLSTLLCALPERLSQCVGVMLGWLVGRVLRIRRDVVDRNLLLAFPDRSRGWRKRVAAACYVHLGRESVAVVRLAGFAAEEVTARTSVAGLDVFREALDAGRGVVLVTGHLGNWEIGGAALAGYGVPVLGVAKGMANRRFGEALTATRARLGVGTVDVSRAPKEVMRALRAGGAVALVADQDARKAGVFVPFFGTLASTARGPAVFAARTGCPLFLGTMLREPGLRPRYRLVLQRIDVERTGDTDADVLALTAAHTAALERSVRAAPEQYFWQHNRWKTPPRAAAGPEPPSGASV